MNKLVLASSNPGKLCEIEALLAPLGIEVVPQSRLGIDDADEPHATFVENALAKARHASRKSRLPALADDSGICVDALSGEPGIRSARFAADEARGLARDAIDARNNAKLVRLLSGASSRAAHYYCVMVLVRSADDPEPLIAEGRWSGEIVERPRGAGGFGYDPHFLVPDLDLTAAELDPAQKNALSHRGQALRRLIARLKEER